MAKCSHQASLVSDVKGNLEVLSVRANVDADGIVPPCGHQQCYRFLQPNLDVAEDLMRKVPTWVFLRAASLCSRDMAACSQAGVAGSAGPSVSSAPVSHTRHQAAHTLNV